MHDDDALTRDLEFFERQLALIGTPTSPWEQGLCNAYGALARSIRQRLRHPPLEHAAPAPATGTAHR